MVLFRQVGEDVFHEWGYENETTSAHVGVIDIEFIFLLNLYKHKTR